MAVPDRFIHNLQVAIRSKTGVLEIYARFLESFYTGELIFK